MFYQILLDDKDLFSKSKVYDENKYLVSSGYENFKKLLNLYLEDQTYVEGYVQDIADGYNSPNTCKILRKTYTILEFVFPLNAKKGQEKEKPDPVFISRDYQHSQGPILLNFLSKVVTPASFKTNNFKIAYLIWNNQEASDALHAGFPHLSYIDSDKLISKFISSLSLS